MKNGYQHFSALKSYQSGADQLSEPKIHTVNEMIKLSQQQHVPMQDDSALVKHLVDPENRVPSQLYAVIGEILKLIKSIEQQ
ncbi:flagellar biosynthesis protein [Parageobacillus thermantarcticus]|uniref:Flagellar biosynthesis protein n=1 Tax=Parageobacillus thermantarcticus TaxID=186116 RepID=A0A1I0SYF6_9BACL|nr:flagellar biosynthesis protein FlhB [Parageobacillus thermantarcticus]SFA44423.1 flagellar biosynthesis protein [Parageobacillus thermantarcticus]